MVRVIFFSEPIWALGSIHQGLSRALYSHDVLADVLDWSTSYRADDMDLMNRSHDYFITKPDALDSLATYRIPLNKIIVVAHAAWDLYLTKEKCGVDIFDHVKAYGVVSKGLIKVSKDLGIKRAPQFMPIGIQTGRFDQPPAKKLQRVGYAAAVNSFNYQREEIKRGQLAEQATQLAGLEFVKSDRYNLFGMPAFYESVDAVIMSSSEEAVGLPMLEAAAAGRLTIGTPVGYYKQHGQASGGIIAPLPAEDFVKTVSAKLRSYSQNQVDFAKTCRTIQSYAKAHYDWEQSLEPWLKLIGA